MSTPNTPEPPPKPVDATAAWDLVLADIEERDKMGTAKYGVRLTPGDGRDSLVDAYQESLDLAVYLRKRIEEESTAKAELARIRDELAASRAREQALREALEVADRMYDEACEQLRSEENNMDQARAEVERLREAVDGIGGLTGTWVQEVGGRFVVRFSFEGETSFETAEQAHEAGREYMRIVAEIVAGDRNKPAPGWTVEEFGGDGQATLWAAHRDTFTTGVYDTEPEAVAHTWKHRDAEIERLRDAIRAARIDLDHLISRNDANRASKVATLEEQALRVEVERLRSILVRVQPYVPEDVLDALARDRRRLVTRDTPCRGCGETCCSQDEDAPAGSSWDTCGGCYDALAREDGGE